MLYVNAASFSDTAPVKNNLGGSLDFFRPEPLATENEELLRKDGAIRWVGTFLLPTLALASS
jgi:hypothetical protein